MALAFEQQPKESDKAFAAFATYLSMGPERSTAAVAKQLAKSEQLVRRWSARWQWTDRVAAHAAHLAVIEREAIEGLAVERAVEWSKVHEVVKIAEWQRHKKLIALADEMIARWEKNKAKCGTLEGIARVLELATKLGRLAAGMPTEVKEVNTTVSGEDGGPIKVELEVALRKVYGDGEMGRRGDAETIVEAEVIADPPSLDASYGAARPPAPKSSGGTREEQR